MSLNTKQIEDWNLEIQGEIKKYFAEKYWKADQLDYSIISRLVCWWITFKQVAFIRQNYNLPILPKIQGFSKKTYVF